MDGRNEYTEEVMKELQELRRFALENGDEIRYNVLQRSMRNETREFYDAIKPEVYCPSRVRIGGDGDSGKISCNPLKVKDDCTIMSLGLNNQIQFDEEIQSITNKKCKLIGADMNEQNKTTKDKYANMNGMLFVGEIPVTLKLFRMMIDSNSKEIEILKMDIESAEHEALEPFLMKYTVCQILVEIHGYPKKQLEMIQKMAKLGYRIFSLEPNPRCSICCEYSFMNELCYNQYNMYPLSISIPIDSSTYSKPSSDVII